MGHGRFIGIWDAHLLTVNGGSKSNCSQRVAATQTRFTFTGHVVRPASIDLYGYGIERRLGVFFNAHRRTLKIYTHSQASAIHAKNKKRSIHQPYKQQLFLNITRWPSTFGPSIPPTDVPDKVTGQGTRNERGRNLPTATRTAAALLRASK
ncbi:hypothetical protein ACLOJK_024540 [Asimina triloba]